MEVWELICGLTASRPSQDRPTSGEVKGAGRTDGWLAAELEYSLGSLFEERRRESCGVEC